MVSDSNFPPDGTYGATATTSPTLCSSSATNDSSVVETAAGSPAIIAPTAGSPAIIAPTTTYDKDKDNATNSSNSASNTHNTSSTRKQSFQLVRYLSDVPEWESYDDDQERFIQELPKMELHVHLDGTFDPDFLWKYMQDHPDSVMCLPCQSYLPWNGRSLPVRQLVEDCTISKDYHKLCTCRGYRSLQQMLTCFEIFLPLVRRNLTLLEQLAFDFCQRQWEQNVVYTEVRYSPFLLAEGFGGDDDGNNDTAADNQQQSKNNDQDKDDEKTTTNNEVDAEAVLKAVTSGLRRGCHKFGITVNQILCAITWRPDWAQPTLDLVRDHLHDYPCATVGIDIAAGEEHFDEAKYPDMHKIHYEVFQKAQTLPEYKNIPITIHAGEAPEDSSYENVRRAVEEYGATRIGHGYRAVRDKALMQKLRQNKIHLEVCPTSSVETGAWVYPNKGKNWMEHPIVEMREAGLKFSFSSDDPAVFHTSLAWQYRVAMAKMDFTRQQMLDCNLQAIEAAFCSPEEKRKLRQHVLDFAAFSGLELCVDGEGGTVDNNGGDDDDDDDDTTIPPPPPPTWRRTSSCVSNTSSIHRPVHITEAHLEGGLPLSSSSSQWKRSMSANFVDRVYVYKPGAGDDEGKVYEYL